MLHPKGGTLRVGTYDCRLVPQSLAFRLYKQAQISERHHNHYEINSAYLQEFEKNGLHISGTSPDGALIEIIELMDHPFMVATQAHPEFTSRPLAPHPLFLGFVETMLENVGVRG